MINRKDILNSTDPSKETKEETQKYTSYMDHFYSGGDMQNHSSSNDYSHQYDQNISHKDDDYLDKFDYSYEKYDNSHDCNNENTNLNEFQEIKKSENKGNINYEPTEWKEEIIEKARQDRNQEENLETQGKYA